MYVRSDQVVLILMVEKVALLDLLWEMPHVGKRRFFPDPELTIDPPPRVLPESEGLIYAFSRSVPFETARG